MSRSESDIAIVGMGCRFPEASTPDEFWDTLQRRESMLRPTGRERKPVPGYVDVCAPLAGIDQFDPGFFGMTHAEACQVDPQQRLFLECAWQALESAGYAERRHDRRIGVFGASSLSTYLLHNLLHGGALDEAEVYRVLLGNDKDFLATRVSYRLDLRGASLSVQSACSSSLVAVHLACQHLLAGESEMALAGGVSVSVPQHRGHIHKPGGILSDHPSCRAFDRQAAGTVKGNGCGVVLLKPLDAALADRDHVYAVIEATAVNNDGASKANYMAPTVRGQAEVIREALDVAGVSAAELDYVETHGTGTLLGDMVEIEALATVLGEGHEAREQPIVLGTLKPNIGHLDAAAGIAGLIKASLVLAWQRVPAAVGFDTPNPDLRLAERGLCVSTGAHDGGRVPIRHAGVSAFGVGGTNAHAVLGRFVPPATDSLPDRAVPIVLSAQSGAALSTLAARLHVALSRHPWNLIDVAYTLACRRRAHACRIGFVATDPADLLARLARPETLPSSQGAEAAGGASRTALDEMVQRWLGGAAVDFGALPVMRTARCVPLPGYVFDYRSCWIEPRAAAGGPADTRITVAEPRAEAGQVLEVLLAVCRERLGTQRIDIDIALDEQGVDSIMLVDLLYDLQVRFGVSVPMALAAQLGSPARLAGEVARRIAAAGAQRVEPVVDGSDARPVSGARRRASAAARLVPIVEGPGERRIVLIHPAGGTISVYADLCGLLDDPPVSVYGLPFHDTAEVGGHDTLVDLARRYADLVDHDLGGGPLVIGGYSFGGNMAFEVALQIESQGAIPPNLLLIDSHAPSAYRSSGPSPTDAERAESFALVAHAIGNARHDEAMDEAEIARRYRDLAPDALAAALVEAGVTPPGLSRADVLAFYRTWVTHHRMLRTGGSVRRLGASALLLEAREPESRRILDNLAIAHAERRRWCEHLAGELRIEPIPGNHYTAFSHADHLRVLAGKFAGAMRDDWLWQPLGQIT